MENKWLILSYFKKEKKIGYNNFTNTLTKVEVKTMKKRNFVNWKANMWKVVASLALVVTTLSVNTTCMFEYYQPKMPTGSEKLKRS